VVVAACVAHAHAESAGSELEAASLSTGSLGRPNPAVGPTKVFVQIWFADVDNIDSAKQNYTANVYIRLRWTDPRLARREKGPKPYDLKDIWHPPVIIANEIGLVRRTLPETAVVTPEGTVICRQRYVGVFSQPLQLKEFPFDSHVFRLHLVLPGYSPQEVEFAADETLPNRGGPRSADGAGIADEISLPDWDIQWCRTMPLPYVTTAGGMVAAGYAMDFKARRDWGYFVWKIVGPLTLIVLMSWLVFWIDPTHAGTQIGVGTMAMLTLIAYRFAIDQSVPKVDYLTRLDYFVIGATLLVFLALCQVVVTASLAQKDRLALARRMDQWSRVIFLILLAGLIVGSLLV
jgi:hypothetical protein